ncbi:WG repeat-containing protein [Aquirufa sp. HETE-83D]|uniref:WG repeat-containing protein n=1 Tax=Aquirufa esocilacus TaxID=3096513 RepID=A0ABW6DPS4_9BACT
MKTKIQTKFQFTLLLITIILNTFVVDGQNVIPVRNAFNNGYDYIEVASNKIVSRATYDQAFPYKEGFARVSRNGFWGFINEDGIEIIPCKYIDANDFSEGLASVSIGTIEITESGYIIKKDVKYGVIDKEGTKTIAFRFKDIKSFNKQMALAQDLESEKWGWIDELGNWNSLRKYDYAEDFNELGLAKVGNQKIASDEGNEGKDYIAYGIINREENFVIPQNYFHLGKFNNGIIEAIKFNNDYTAGYSGLLDEKGRTIIQFIYHSVENFSQNLALVSYKQNQKIKYGFVDKKGQIKIALKYDYANSFIKGMAFIKSNGKFGWINNLGEPVFQQNYDVAENFINDTIPKAGYDHTQVGKSKFAIVSNNGAWGAISRYGEEIIPIKYDSIVKTANGFIAIDTISKKYFDLLGKHIKSEPYANNKKIGGVRIAGNSESLYGDIASLNSIQNSPNRNITSESYIYGGGSLNSDKRLSKNEKYYGILNKDSTQFCNYVYDSIKSISERCNLDFGLIGYKNNHTEIIRINNEGMLEVIPTIYSKIENLNYSSDDFIRVSQNEKWGIASIKGGILSEIIKPIYEDVGRFPKFAEVILFPIKKNEKWGFCNEKGIVVIPFKYDKVGTFYGNSCEVMLNNKWGIINRYGFPLTKFEYDDLTLYNEKGLKGMEKDKKWGLIDIHGNISTLNIFDGLLINNHNRELSGHIRKMIISIDHYSSTGIEYY